MMPIMDCDSEIIHESTGLSAFTQEWTGIELLHERQITHRDIKPENIMVNSHGGCAFLIDFGLAYSSNYAMLKGAVGTRRYAAPECGEGVCDHLSDIYSRGGYC